MLKDALSTNEDYSLRLFKNDYTPVAGTLASDFTTTTFTNYVNKTLTRAGWGTPTTVSSKAQCDYSSTQSWTCGATGDTVFGYYVLGATSNVCLWAERFATARTLANGDILSLTPSFVLHSETND